MSKSESKRSNQKTKCITQKILRHLQLREFPKLFYFDEQEIFEIINEHHDHTKL